MAYNMTQFLVTVVSARPFNPKEQDEIAENIRRLIRDKDQKGALLHKPDYSIVDIEAHYAGCISFGEE